MHWKIDKYCPHPNLVPILLDILRSCAAGKSSHSDVMVKLHLEILVILDPFFEDMKSRVVTNNTETSQPTTPINRVSMLMSNIEVFLSTAAMIRLICTQYQCKSVEFEETLAVKKEVDIFLNVFRSLYDIIHEAFQEWRQDCPADQNKKLYVYGDPPDNYFRLNLLEHALKEILEDDQFHS